MKTNKMFAGTYQALLYETDIQDMMNNKSEKRNEKCIKFNDRKLVMKIIRYIKQML